MTQIIDEADDDPQTEAEDWRAMGVEALRARVSAISSNSVALEKAGSQREENTTPRPMLIKTKLRAEHGRNTQAHVDVDVEGKIKQEHEIVIGTDFSLHRSKRVRSITSKTEN